MTRTFLKGLALAALVGLSALSLPATAEAGRGWGGHSWGGHGYYGGRGWGGPGYWGAGRNLSAVTSSNLPSLHLSKR